jgi:hypothetical protein
VEAQSINRIKTRKGKDAMNNKKRIQKIEVKRIFDADPDTSHLGKYSNTPEGDYSIDRKHSLECTVNNPHISEVSNKLNRVLTYLHKRSSEVGNNSEDPYYWGFADAQDIIGEAQEAAAACNCNESGDWSHGEMQYFNTSGNYIGEPLADIVQYTKQDYTRMEAYNDNDWGFIGIQARAEIVLDEVCQTITSGGLWGIESDSEDSYFQEVEHEELTSLRGILHTMGFSKRAIATACKASK